MQLDAGIKAMQANLIKILFRKIACFMTILADFMSKKKTDVSAEGYWTSLPISFLLSMVEFLKAGTYDNFKCIDIYFTFVSMLYF